MAILAMPSNHAMALIQYLLTTLLFMSRQSLLGHSAQPTHLASCETHSHTMLHFKLTRHKMYSLGPPLIFFQNVISSKDPARFSELFSQP